MTCDTIAVCAIHGLYIVIICSQVLRLAIKQLLKSIYYPNKILVSKAISILLDVYKELVHIY